MSCFDYSTVPICSREHDFRFLVLHASLELDTISCTIRVASLDAPPAYFALSYTWDNPFPNTNESHIDDVPALPPKAILMNGVEMTVQGNLEAYMRHASPKSEGDKDVMIWADALCINQDDDSEKNEQIQLMRRIYEEAAQVIIWLGPSDVQTDIAVDFLNEVGEIAVECGILGFREEAMMHVMNEALEDSDDEYASFRARLRVLRETWYDNIPIEACKHFYGRSWWYRTWVMQELCLGRKVEFRCGNKKSSFEKMVASYIFYTTYLHCLTSSFKYDPQELMENPHLLARVLRVFNGLPDVRPGKMLGTRRRFQNRTKLDTREPFDLMQVLIRTHVRSVASELGCTKRRDRVYGLLGLADDAAELRLKIDYSPQYSIEEVFIDTALKLLHQGHSDVLALSQGPVKNLTTLPSWVPDWSGPIQEPCGGTVLDKFFCACADTRLSVLSHGRLDGDKHFISLEGLTVCRIAQVGTPWDPAVKDWKFDWTQAGVLFEEVDQFCRASDEIGADIYSKPHMREEAAIRTLCFDQERIGAIRRRAGRLSEGPMLKGFGLVERTVKDPTQILTLTPFPEFTAFQITMGEMHWRRPFVSDEGRVGLAPSDALPGDLIVILKGVIVPLALRLFGDFKYKLLGETYVHGVMDGELINDATSFKSFSIL